MCQWATRHFLNARESPVLLENILTSLRTSSNQVAEEAISWIKESLEDAKDNLVGTQGRTMHQVDRNRRIKDWEEI